MFTCQVGFCKNSVMLPGHFPVLLLFYRCLKEYSSLPPGAWPLQSSDICPAPQLCLRHLHPGSFHIFFQKTSVSKVRKQPIHQLCSCSLAAAAWRPRYIRPPPGSPGNTTELPRWRRSGSVCPDPAAQSRLILHFFFQTGENSFHGLLKFLI